MSAARIAASFRLSVTFPLQPAEPIISLAERSAPSSVGRARRPAVGVRDGDDRGSFQTENGRWRWG
jgi:hypothetical protein